MEGKIHLASDHAGVKMRKELCKTLTEWGYSIIDHGPFSSDSVDYPDFAKLVCQAVLANQEDRGILLCGTGLGMSYSANRFKGIRAALCYHTTAAKLSRKHNNSNILVMGARMIGLDLAKEIIKTWLETQFSEAKRHKRRIEKIDNI